MTFTALTEAQWKAIQSTHNWPDGTDWRGRIEQTGRHFCEARAEREAWVKTFRAEKPAEEKERVDRALRLTHELQKAWADSSLEETDLPGLKLRQQRAERWLHNYDIWVTPFSGQRDPMQNQLEWTLISIWVDAGGKLDYSRRPEKKPSPEGHRYRRPSRQEQARTDPALADDRRDRPGIPYGPLVDFLTHTLEAILGRTYQPSSIASIIDRHRPEIAKARGMRRRRRGGRFA